MQPICVLIVAATRLTNCVAVCVENSAVICLLRVYFRKFFFVLKENALQIPQICVNNEQRHYNFMMYFYLLYLP
jgi:hypothetical protein